MPKEIAQDALLLDQLLDEALRGFPSVSVKAQPLSPLSGEASAVPSVLRALTVSTTRFHQPPQEVVPLERPRKVEVATHLAQWMARTLERENVQSAVITRQGGRQHRQHDSTGMLHSGIVWRDPLDGGWKIYNLVDYKTKGKPHCRVLWTKPVEFFYQQGGYDPAALLLIPSTAIQNRMAALLQDGGFQRLAFTPQYNLLSPPHGPDSLNCNKWVLLNVLAAHHNTEDPAFLLREIQRNFRAEPLALDPLTRLFAGWHPQVRGKELSWWAAPRTVTVESLVNSGLFERTVSYAPHRSAL
ncbi:DUF2145 domain-containing protein [Vampirovibrio chlorellavorus]|uniref:DUF2145 domain-containing protein n=1 Tax=Vampirovibrio chlorellavorus TaxID=758823 RepID=UPI0026F2BBA0|nr:DUF2145 domain-containing protein [Vampirovibrio chlorellavorus]